MGLPEDIYAAVDSCETTQEIWLRVEQIMKGSTIGAQEKKAKLFNEWEKFKSTEGESIESYYNRFSNRNGIDLLPLFIKQSICAKWTILSCQIEGNQNGYNTTQNVRNQVVHNAVQNPGIQNGNQRGLIVVPGIANPNANQNGNSNVVAAQDGGNVNGNNGNQIWCYNYRGMAHLARNCTIRPRRRDAAYLQTQLLIAQKKEAGIQLQAEEYDLMQALTSGTQTDKAPVYHLDGSAKVHHDENCYNNDIFNMFSQEEQYTEVLEPILEPYQIQQNNNNVTSVDSSVEQSGGTVNQHPATVEETCAHYESLFNNLAVEVEKVNAVNRKLKETNVVLTTELARYKG
ncbi:hypothetical protein Tco_0727245 [Tanacetum coccineum]|uniref:Gag-Pol polyprotein n=1 Tax=Tanacetum coccineum TaxID=301880 RepID=A0ABQ4YHW2_9ASTR